MLAATDIAPITEEKKSILRILLYFDIFNYPLTATEIHRFSPGMLSAEWEIALRELQEQNLLYSSQGFFMLRNDPSLAIRRQTGNSRAQKKLALARKLSYVISLFPFVRAVMLSGSISKGYMDEQSDIDYFIITAPRRLWIVRFGMALFRRIFLFNSHKNFCTNYFIDEDSLVIEQKNIFTAIEIATLKPMFGENIFAKFNHANQWVLRYLPQHKMEHSPDGDKDGVLKNYAERRLSGKWPDKLESWLMKKFETHWRKRYVHSLNNDDFAIAFQSTPHVSRSHPEFYQKKVLSLYSQRIKEFEDYHQLSLQYE